MKTILVTGGNRGIGLAIVKGLAKTQENYILLGCRDIEKAQKIVTNFGENIIPVHIDLSDRTILKSNLETIIEQYPRIDGLVNNAGIINRNDFLNENFSDFDQIIRINTIAPFEIIKKILPKMIANNFGRIVNVSSGFGSFHEGLEGPFSYSLSKAALNGITLIAAKELPANVKINSMCPGWVRSDMGGEEAPRSVEEGAETAIWLINQPENSPSGKFFRDKMEINW